MTIFGDVDPEDELDAMDPPAVQLEVLERTVASLAAEVAGPHELVRVLARLVGAARALGRLQTLGADRRRLDELALRLAALVEVIGS